ncbi:MAG TPA: hypothetical protein PL056_10595 [bacterium]|nr:hypothetical protein [bacterium]
MKYNSSENVLEIIARTGGVFNTEILDKIFNADSFVKYLKRKNELEYISKQGVANYIYKIPDKYIREYHNVRWVRSKDLNSKGELEFRKRVVKYLRENGIKGKYNRFQGERFYKEIFKEMFTPENEKIYWNYYFDGLNENHIIYSFAMQLLYISDCIIPYTKGLLTENFPDYFQKYSGKGMYFSIVEDYRGAERLGCVIIESMKPYDSIFRILEKFGKFPLLKDRCLFYIVSGNKNSLKTLENRIKNYRKSITDNSGNLVRYEKNYFSEIRIQYRYYEELDRILNRGVK